MLEDLIKPENIIMELESSDKDDVFSELLEQIIQRQNENLPVKNPHPVQKSKGLFGLFSKKSANETESKVVAASSSINRSEILNLINEREEKQSSDMQNGFSVVHVSCESVSKPCIQVGISHDGINFSSSNYFSSNNQKASFVYVFIMILLDKSNSEEHLKLLSEVASLIDKSGFCAEILKATSKEQVCSLLKSN